jgi:predicted O-methyltransferase YrrM
MGQTGSTVRLKSIVKKVLRQALRAVNSLLSLSGFEITRIKPPEPVGQPAPGYNPAYTEPLPPRDYFSGLYFRGLIDYRGDAALRLLGDLEAFRDEYTSFEVRATGEPGMFYLENTFFEEVDSEVLYSMVRRFRPARVIEVGSGYSSLLIRMALDRNANGGRLTCIDPVPSIDVSTVADEPFRAPLQDFPVERFEELGEDDMLFIDSSHIVVTGGSLTHIFFGVLQRLSPGVLVHFHDIYLPGEYPYEWVSGEERGYNEQYLLLAFLIGNRDYEVVWPGYCMKVEHPDELAQAFPSMKEDTGPGSFWVRKLR